MITKLVMLTPELEKRRICTGSTYNRMPQKYMQCGDFVQNREGLTGWKGALAGRSIFIPNVTYITPPLPVVTKIPHIPPHGRYWGSKARLGYWTGMSPGKLLWAVYYQIAAAPHVCIALWLSPKNTTSRVKGPLLSIRTSMAGTCFVWQESWPSSSGLFWPFIGTLTSLAAKGAGSGRSLHLIGRVDSLRAGG